MMAAVTAVVAVAMAMTMGWDGNGGDVDNGCDSSGGNAGDDDDETTMATVFITFIYT